MDLEKNAIKIVTAIFLQHAVIIQLYQVINFAVQEVIKRES
jgi:hypothetical protein